MTREELWVVFAKRNPALLGDGAEPVTLRRRGLKKIFDAAYDAGREEGRGFGELKDRDLPDALREIFR
jgi:hypothetical protein